MKIDKYAMSCETETEKTLSDRPKVRSKSKQTRESISRYINEADRISYGEAVSILLSIGFGVSYMDIFALLDYNVDCTIIGLTLNLVIGIAAVCMLYDVKQEHKNKLGSYQEIAYYFTRDRSLIFSISLIYVFESFTTSSYAFYYSTNHIYDLIVYHTMAGEEPSEFDSLWIYAVILIALAAAIFPLTAYQNYQNYKKLTYLLLGSFAMAFVCTWIQILICIWETRSDMTLEVKQKYIELHASVVADQNCNAGAYKIQCIRSFMSDADLNGLTLARITAALIFQFYYLQVIQTLDSKYGEHTGFDESQKAEVKPNVKQKRKVGLEIGLITVVLLYIFYMSIIVSIKYTQVDVPNFDKVSQFRKTAIWTVFNIGFGFKTRRYCISEWPLVFLIQSSIILQLLVHIPYIYYIGKENFLMMFDEHQNYNLTSMVNRVRSEQGDPRYFLAELRNNSRSKINKGEGAKVVFLHRLPHMKLSKPLLLRLNLYLYSLVVLLTLLFNYTSLVFDLISFSLGGFDQMIIPGALFYYKYK